MPPKRQRATATRRKTTTGILNLRKKRVRTLQDLSTEAEWLRCFECRRQTLMLKAKQLEEACGVVVTVTVKSPDGLVYYYGGNPVVISMLQRSGLLGSHSVNAKEMIVTGAASNSLDPTTGNTTRTKPAAKIQPRSSQTTFNPQVTSVFSSDDGHSTSTSNVQTNSSTNIRSNPTFNCSANQSKPPPNKQPGSTQSKSATATLTKKTPDPNKSTFSHRQFNKSELRVNLSRVTSYTNPSSNEVPSPNNTNNPANTNHPPNHSNQPANANHPPNHSNPPANTNHLPNHSNHPSNTNHPPNHSNPPAKTNHLPNHLNKPANTNHPPNHSKQPANKFPPFKRTNPPARSRTNRLINVDINLLKPTKLPQSEPSPPTSHLTIQGDGSSESNDSSSSDADSSSSDSDSSSSDSDSSESGSSDSDSSDADSSDSDESTESGSDDEIALVATHKYETPQHMFVKEQLLMNSSGSVTIAKPTNSQSSPVAAMAQKVAASKSQPLLASNVETNLKCEVQVAATRCPNDGKEKVTRNPTPQHSTSKCDDVSAGVTDRHVESVSSKVLSNNEINSSTNWPPDDIDWQDLPENLFNMTKSEPQKRNLNCESCNVKIKKMKISENEENNILCKQNKEKTKQMKRPASQKDIHCHDKIPNKSNLKSDTKFSRCCTIPLDGSKDNNVDKDDLHSLSKSCKQSFEFVFSDENLYANVPFRKHVLKNEIHNCGSPIHNIINQDSNFKYLKVKLNKHFHSWKEKVEFIQNSLTTSSSLRAYKSGNVGVCDKKENSIFTFKAKSFNIQLRDGTSANDVHCNHCFLRFFIDYVVVDF